MMRGPLLQIVIGFILVLSATILAWLLVLGYLPSTLLLNLFVFAMSVIGLTLGSVGAASYVKFSRNSKKNI